MEIPIGATHEEQLLVTPDVAIDFLGLESARVLSTPHLIGYLEMTSRNLIKRFLPEGEDSVGTLVHVRHLAATPIGMHVRLHAQVVEVNGNRVLCKVEAWDERDRIADGQHERFVVDVARFASRVTAKAAGG